jgi:hypothetical protein
MDDAFSITHRGAPVKHDGAYTAMGELFSFSDNSLIKRLPFSAKLSVQELF